MSRWNVCRETDSYQTGLLGVATTHHASLWLYKAVSLYPKQQTSDHYRATGLRLFAPGHNLVGDLYSSFGPEWSIHLNRPALTQTFIQAIHRAEISRLSVPPHGWKDHPGYVNGKWERKESWLKIVRDIKHQRLTFSQLIVADGHLGIWTVLGEFHPTGEEPWCWTQVHHVLDVLPKRVQEKAAKLLKAMPYAKTQAECVSGSAMPLSPVPEDRAEGADTLMRD